MMNDYHLIEFYRLTPSRLLLAMSCIIALASACGPDKGTYVVVQPTGMLTPELRAEATLDGKSYGPAQDFSGLHDSFVLQLPPETKGRFRVDIKGYAGDACAASVGSSEVSLEGQDLYNVSVDLQTPRLAPCQVTGERIMRVWGNDKNDVWAVGLSGTMLHWDGKAWAQIPQGGAFRGTHILGLWSRSVGELLFVGSGGKIVRRVGMADSVLPSGVSTNLFGIAGDTNDVWVVGAKGTILHQESNGWSSRSPTGSDWFPAGIPKDTTDLLDVARLANGTYYAVGLNGIVLRKDPGSSNWTQQSVGTKVDLYTIVATAESAWIVGLNNTLLKWEAGNWVQKNLRTSYDGAFLSVAVSSQNQILLGGIRGTILHCDYSVDPLSCTQMSADAGSAIWSIWSDKSSVSFVGGAPPVPSGQVSSATVFRFRQ